MFSSVNQIWVWSLADYYKPLRRFVILPPSVKKYQWIFCVHCSPYSIYRLYIIYIRSFTLDMPKNALRPNTEIYNYLQVILCQNPTRFAWKMFSLPSGQTVAYFLAATHQLGTILSSKSFQYNCSIHVLQCHFCLSASV